MANVILATALKAPTGLWPTILNWIEKTVVNYGWVIILFTLLIKACLLPMDFVVKYSSKKTTLVQQKLAPQLARIQRKFSNDPNQAKVQTNMLYKREGFNGVVSCLVMLINLVVTMVVFFTLYASLREMSAYKAIQQYESLQLAYTTEYENSIPAAKESFVTLFNEKAAESQTLYKVEVAADGSVTITEQTEYQGLTYDSVKGKFEEQWTVNGEEGEQTIESIFDAFFKISGENLPIEQSTFLSLYFNYNEEDPAQSVRIYDLLIQAGEEAAKPAAEAANAQWKKVKETWLWIDNIWVADNYKSPIPSYKDLSGLVNGSKSYKSYIKEIDQNVYNVVTSSVREQNKGWNGYFILAILAGVTSFLSQWLAERASKPKNKDVNDLVSQANPTGGMMKFMKILLPALMVIFVLTSSAAFGIYIVVSSLISMAFSTVIGLIVDACFKKRQAEVYEYLEKEAVRNLKKKKNRG